jgi:hypothetical protein
LGGGAEEMTMNIPAIETVYKSYRFRSRLEARWAVFFDALGIAWEYEKEGYKLPNGECYLPDFWLPEMRVHGENPLTWARYNKPGVWVEIKGEEATAQEKQRCEQLSGLTQMPVVLFMKGLPHKSYVENSGYGLLFHPEQEDNIVGWMQCVNHSSHLKIACQYDDRHPWIDCPFCGAGSFTSDNTPQLLAAYAAARSARFEFGESGAR